MNERIQELARQASVQTFGHIRNAYFEKKFAELIVRECIDVVGKNTASPNGVQALIKHFGVEE